MLNTPKTFEYHPELKWATYIADCITLLGFTAEMVTKINHMGLYSNEKSYLKDKWCRFDARYVHNIKNPIMFAVYHKFVIHFTMKSM